MTEDKIHVLLVEDNVSIRTMTAARLQEFIAEITRGDRTFRVMELKRDELLSEKGYKDFTIRFY